MLLQVPPPSPALGHAHKPRPPHPEDQRGIAGSFARRCREWTSFALFHRETFFCPAACSPVENQSGQHVTGSQNCTFAISFYCRLFFLVCTVNVTGIELYDHVLSRLGMNGNCNWDCFRVLSLRRPHCGYPPKCPRLLVRQKMRSHLQPRYQS